MGIPLKLSNDELLEQAHNDYIKQVTESGLPLWVADLYGFNPDYVPKITEEQ